MFSVEAGSLLSLDNCFALQLYDRLWFIRRDATKMISVGQIQVI